MVCYLCVCHIVSAVLRCKKKELIGVEIFFFVHGNWSGDAESSYALPSPSVGRISYLLKLRIFLF